MVSRSSGFTLIELMITIAIFALLLMIGAPFTMSWVYGARVNEAKSKLLQGYVLAKALAQRNPGDIRVPAAAAGIKLDGLTLFVCPGDPATLATCVAAGSSVQWQATLPANTTITFGASETLGLDNTGRPLASTSFSITNGTQNETGDLH